MSPAPGGCVETRYDRAALRAARSQSSTKVLLTVHDEIVFDMHKDEQTTVMPLVEECMKTAMPMQVPIV